MAGALASGDISWYFLSNYSRKIAAFRVCESSFSGTFCRSGISSIIMFLVCWILDLYYTVRRKSHIKLFSGKQMLDDSVYSFCTIECIYRQPQDICSFCAQKLFPFFFCSIWPVFSFAVLFL
jgi:hypothetical protein